MRLGLNTSVAVAGILLMVVVTITPVSALADPGTVVTATELDQAMAARSDADAASREAILNWLDRDEVSNAASQAGLDLARVGAAVSTFSGDELREFEAQARLADQSLSGGDEKVVIGSTALIIILLVVIIIVAGN
jgi:hypothetical protein